jgi:DNA-binding transcriptional ArsR family regulator
LANEADNVHQVVNNLPIAELDRSFHALAHPVRRAIVGRLVGGPASVGDATRGAGVSKPAITKHLRVLEDAGIVGRTVRGRTHILTLQAHPLAEASKWIEGQRRLWERKLDIVGDYLEEGE